MAANNPALGRITNMMGRQISHLVRLVDDLLDVSRVSRGKIDLRRQPVEVAAVVRTAVETASGGPAWKTYSGATSRRTAIS